MKIKLGYLLERTNRDIHRQKKAETQELRKKDARLPIERAKSARETGNPGTREKA